MYQKCHFTLFSKKLYNRFNFGRRQDGAGDHTFEFLWRLDGSVSYTIPINGVTAFADSLFDMANAPTPKQRNSGLGFQTHMYHQLAKSSENIV